jgi:hypothetical protein
MWHDESCNRPGQDPEGYLPYSQWMAHYEERIRFYQSMVEQFPGRAYFQVQLANYRQWLAMCSENLPTDHQGIPF